jgi:hypothetical protein
MFDLHAVSIFATGTGESVTTTPFLVFVLQFSMIFMTDENVNIFK